MRFRTILRRKAIYVSMGIFSFLIGSCAKSPSAGGFQLDYDETILLDAEDLAEGGIGKAYEALLPKLRQYMAQPAAVKELLDNDTPRYAVQSGVKEFVIYAPELDETTGNSWGRAAAAFFTIVNDQLAETEYRFFAINGGNDLCGIFLTPAQAEASREALPNKSDWPYLPKDEHPWYGQHR